MAQHLNNVIISNMSNLLSVPNINNPDIDSRFTERSDIDQEESMGIDWNHPYNEQNEDHWSTFNLHLLISITGHGFYWFTTGN
jgi:hypothetical protein